ncbi:MAG: branched-chain amino acid ABC transporter permease [Oscillospiraceae bacterium]|nr:branched-chain amino acid ABC transporter permease [Oscillospiraceae bacterium]
MVLTWQTIITIGSVLGALTLIFKTYNKVYDMIKHQKEQDEAIKSIREEQTLMTFGILACLKGLHEQGANGPVTEAIEKFEKHLNQKAHKI